MKYLTFIFVFLAIFASLSFCGETDAAKKAEEQKDKSKQKEEGKTIKIDEKHTKTIQKEEQQKSDKKNQKSGDVKTETDDLKADASIYGGSLMSLAAILALNQAI